MACSATIGERLGANVSGENAKNAANANGDDMSGESMSAGNETAGMIGVNGDSNSANNDLTTTAAGASRRAPASAGLSL